MPRFKEGPPDVAPHVVAEELADIAHSYGYYIQLGLTLCYHKDGDEYVITVSKPEYIEAEYG